VVRLATIVAILVSTLVLAGVVIAELGYAPSTPAGWGLLILLGIPAYLVANALGELGMKAVGATGARLRLGRLGRIALLVVFVFPLILVSAYFANR